MPRMVSLDSRGLGELGGHLRVSDVTSWCVGVANFYMVDTFLR